jgi:multiple sugar transport system permease protein
MSKKTLYKISVYTLLIFFACIFLLPFVWTFLASLKPPGMVLESRWLPHKIKASILIDGKKVHINILEKREDSILVIVDGTKQKLRFSNDQIEEISPTLINYDEVINLLPFGRFFLNSLFISLCVMIGQLLICSLGGFAFARLDFPGRDKIFFLYLATLMIPGHLLTIPIYLILREFGLINSYLGVILPGLFSAYGTFLLRQFFKTIPRDLEDAARIDGTSTFGIYWRIILPLSKPALATLGIFIFVGTWNDFFWPFIVLSDNSKLTLTVGLAKFHDLYIADWGKLMAGSMISLIPVVLVYIIFQRYITQGIVLSGLKE